VKKNCSEGKTQVGDVLSVLESDSLKHKKIVENLIRKIETQEKDGGQKSTL